MSENNPWLIHFFQRSHSDDPEAHVPALDFLDSGELPQKVISTFHAVLHEVAKAPPPSYSGGGYWEAMHGEMSGIYEVRVAGGGKNHRLFCLLDRNADDLGGPSIIVLGGLSKPRRSPARPRDYRRIKQFRDEFSRNRLVLN